MGSVIDVLVVGARGAVGAAAAGELTRLGHRVTAASRGSTDNRLDLTADDAFERFAQLASVHDVVINASGVEDVRLAEAAGAAVLVDISATASYLAALRSATSGQRRVVLGAGLVPGLSTIMIDALRPKRDADIDLAIVLGTGEAHGPAAVAWTAALAGSSLFDPPEGGEVRNFLESRRFASALGARQHLRADFPDHELVGRPAGARVRSYLATGGRLTTAALAMTGRFPVLAPLISRAPHVGDARWSLTAVDRASGRTLRASGHGQSATTGLVTAWAAVAAAELASGAVTMADLFTLDDVRSLAAGRFMI